MVTRLLVMGRVGVLGRHNLRGLVLQHLAAHHGR